jgi:hypothetical protein
MGLSFSDISRKFGNGILVANITSNAVQTNSAKATTLYEANIPVGTSAIQVSEFVELCYLLFNWLRWQGHNVDFGAVLNKTLSYWSEQ